MLVYNYDTKLKSYKEKKVCPTQEAFVFFSRVFT